MLTFCLGKIVIHFFVFIFQRMIQRGRTQTTCPVSTSQFGHPYLPLNVARFVFDEPPSKTTYTNPVQPLLKEYNFV